MSDPAQPSPHFHSPRQQLEAAIAALDDGRLYEAAGLAYAVSQTLAHMAVNQPPKKNAMQQWLEFYHANR